MRCIRIYESTSVSYPEYFSTEVSLHADSRVLEE